MDGIQMIYEIELTPQEVMSCILFEEDNTIFARYPDIVCMGVKLSRDETLIRLGEANKRRIIKHGAYKGFIRIDIKDDTYSYMYLPTYPSRVTELMKEKRMQNQYETAKHSTEEDKMKDPQEEVEITSLHEGIYNYSEAVLDFQKQTEKLRKQYENDKNVLEAIIRTNLGLDDEQTVSVHSDVVSILFSSCISSKVFEKLENTGLMYSVEQIDGVLFLQIQLNTTEEED